MDSKECLEAQADIMCSLLLLYLLSAHTCIVACGTIICGEGHIDGRKVSADSSNITYPWLTHLAEAWLSHAAAKGTPPRSDDCPCLILPFYYSVMTIRSPINKREKLELASTRCFRKQCAQRGIFTVVYHQHQPGFPLESNSPPDQPTKSLCSGHAYPPLSSYMPRSRRPACPLAAALTMW